MQNKCLSIEHQIGANILSLRKSFGIKQSELAKILNVTTSTVSHYESGTNIPSVSALISLADYFGVSVDYILGQTSIKMDWRTYSREIKMIDGSTISLEAFFNAFLSLSEQNQSDLFRLLRLFQIEEQINRAKIRSEKKPEFNKSTLDKMLDSWFDDE